MTTPNTVGKVPTGTYTGNGTDEILITNVGQVTTSQTIHAYGVRHARREDRVHVGVDAAY